MTNFWDLPRAVRDRIYRLHLVKGEPLSVSGHLDMCQAEYWNHRKRVPPILETDGRLDREAAPVYFGENHFLFKDMSIQRITGYLYPRHLRLIRKITCDWVPTEDGVSYTFAEISRMSRLQELNIRVDEDAMIQAMLYRRDGRGHVRKPGPFTAQEQLALYRFPGMSGLLSLSGIPVVNFLKRKDYNKRETGGPLPDGVLMTEVLPKITSQLLKQNPAKGRVKKKDAAKRAKSSTASHFDFLELPPELRNRIYELLIRKGPIQPTRKAPSSAALTQNKHNPSANLESSLNLLLVNKQINDEAMGIFYACNSFVFYYPLQFTLFFHSLDQKRRRMIRDVTIHYRNLVQGGDDLAELTLRLLRDMTGLRRVRVIMENELERKIHYRHWHHGYHIEKANPSAMPGMASLFDLGGLEHISVRDLSLESQYDKLKLSTRFPDFVSRTRDGCVVRLQRALDHFNLALTLAQKGKIDKAFFDDPKWHLQDEFPAIEIIEESFNGAGAQTKGEEEDSENSEQATLQTEPEEEEDMGEEIVVMPRRKLRSGRIV